jgi:hypothetical protein
LETYSGQDAEIFEGEGYAGAGGGDTPRLVGAR